MYFVFLNILYFISYISAFDAFMLRNETVVTTKCEYYNETLCSESATGCETELIDECDKNRTNHCYVVWSNDTRGLITIKFKGCFSENKVCDGRKSCVDQSYRKPQALYSCCCEGDFCNKDFLWSPTPAPPVEKSMPESSFIEQNILLIVVLIMIPVSVCIFCFISVVYRARRKLHQMSDSERSSLCSSPTMNRLLPIELNVEKAQGRFGSVWKAKLDDTPVAVKIISVEHKQSWLTEEEVYNLPLMKHENILRFIAAERRGDSFMLQYWLITEYHEIGSLNDYLRVNTVSLKQLFHIAYTMTRGLAHLHEEIYSEREGLRKPSVLHRDFKSKNVLLKNGLTACIADFGLAIIFSQAGDTFNEKQKQVGTTRYMAPEVLTGSVTYCKDSFLSMDTYACGLVLWELLSRCTAHGGIVPEYKLPYEEELGKQPSINDLKEFVALGERRRPAIQESWKSHPELANYIETIEECWDHEPGSRLSATCVMLRLADSNHRVM